jgi:streptogramin lyase
MRPKFLALTFVLVFAMALLMAVVVGAGSLVVEEADLSSSGEVYEIDRDAQSTLFISDSGAREVWRVDATGAYTIYTNPSTVVDAQPDSDGNIWWTDGATYFGRIDVPTHTVTTWEVGLFQNLGGLALDDQDRVWLTQAFGPNLYRFDPDLAAGQLCTYTLPDGGYSDYILYNEGTVWLASWGDPRILRLDTAAATEQLTYWQIAEADSRPKGMALDPLGHLWWADFGLSALGRLEPSLDRLTIYALPVGTRPQMVTTNGNQVWYTEFSGGSPGTVGQLDPAVAQGLTVTLLVDTATVTPLCGDLTPLDAQPVTVSSGQLDWVAGTAVPVVDDDGWTVYQQGPGYKPYGIAASSGYLWTAVQESQSQKLLRYAVVRQADLSVTVSSSTSTAYHGETITYTYAVSYTSSDGTAANTVAVEDSLCAPLVYRGGDDGNGDLDVGETWTYTCNYQVPAHVDGESNPVINTATATGRDADDNELTPAQDSTMVTILHRKGVLGLVKDGPAIAIHEETITFTYAITYTSPDSSPAHRSVRNLVLYVPVHCARARRCRGKSHHQHGHSHWP